MKQNKKKSITISDLSSLFDVVDAKIVGNEISREKNRTLMMKKIKETKKVY